MNKFKSVLIALVIFVILHAGIVIVFADAKIFPCQISTIGSNMQASEWRDGMCDIHYRYSMGSSQRLTLNAKVERISLMYGLPIVLTGIIMYGLHLRKKRTGVIAK
jgi:hypothetical protein